MQVISKIITKMSSEKVGAAAQFQIEPWLAIISKTATFLRIREDYYFAHHFEKDN